MYWKTTKSYLNLKKLNKHFFRMPQTFVFFKYLSFGLDITYRT